MPDIKNKDSSKTSSSIHAGQVVSLSCNQDIKRLFLVKSPITLDWILLKTLFGDPEIAYLVCDERSNIQYYAGKTCCDIDNSEPALVALFAEVGAGWSREATPNELTVMTRFSAKLNELLESYIIPEMDENDVIPFASPCS